MLIYNYLTFRTSSFEDTTTVSRTADSVLGMECFVTEH